MWANITSVSRNIVFYYVAYVIMCTLKLLGYSMIYPLVCGSWRGMAQKLPFFFLLSPLSPSIVSSPVYCFLSSSFPLSMLTIYITTLLSHAHYRFYNTVTSFIYTEEGLLRTKILQLHILNKRFLQKRTGNSPTLALQLGSFPVSQYRVAIISSHSGRTLILNRAKVAMSRLQDLHNHNKVKVV